VLNQNKSQIVADIADTKKEEGGKLVELLNEGLQEYQKVLEQKDRSVVFPKQKELLHIVGEYVLVVIISTGNFGAYVLL